MKTKFIKAIQRGLPLTQTPWKDLALKNNVTVNELLTETTKAINEKTIKRFGLVVKHRALGFSSNAMVVWDITDEEVCVVGEKMAEYGFVRLCYQRPRVLPHWPFNLFCMIHSKDKKSALSNIEILKKELCLEKINYDVLFSKRCFKQTGAVYR